MARVTVEDCVEKVPNRFELVMLAAQRARNVGAGARLTIDPDNDKNPVIALREIADSTIGLGELENSLIQGLQKVVEMDEPGEEDVDMLSIQKEMGAAPSEPRIVVADEPADEPADEMDDETDDDDVGAEEKADDDGADPDPGSSADPLA